MKILLTGATGFLGSHLARTLVGSEHSVIGLKRRDSDLARLSDVKDAMRFADIEDGLDQVFGNCSDIELVVHAATSYGNQGEPVSEVLATNVLLPLRIMESALSHKRCAFINTDTFFCKTEDSYSYLANYTLSKKLFCQLGAEFARSHEQVFVNVRLEHVFGPGDGSAKFVPSIIRQMLDSVPEIRLTPGEQLRDFVYIDDVVSAYMKIISLIESFECGKMKCFEVGSGSVRTVKDFVSTAHRIIGSKSDLLFGASPYRENEIMYSKANLDALLELGWRSSVNLETGLRNVISSM